MAIHSHGKIKADAAPSARAALVTGSGTITFAENGLRPIASLKRGDLFEFFEFTHLCGDGSLAGVELLPVEFRSFDGKGRGAWFAGECQIIRFGRNGRTQQGAIAEFKFA